MYFLKQFCYICLKHENNLKRLFSNNNENEEYSKLISSVPEMHFKELEDRGMICAQCCTKLDEAHRFRAQCLRSKHFLMDYISKLQSVSETNGVLNVCMQDYTYYLEIPMMNNEHCENNYYNTDKLFSMLNSNYIVIDGEFIDDRDGNTLLVKTETVETENQAESSDVDEVIDEMKVDQLSCSDIGVIFKNKIIIKS